LLDCFRPSVIVSQACAGQPAPWRHYAEAIGRVAEAGFFSGAEIEEIPEPAVRREVAAAGKDLDLTVWLVPWLQKKGLSLCDVDGRDRDIAVGAVLEQLDLAADCSASSIGLWSGPDPGPELRKDATSSFIRSLRMICREAEGHGLRIVVEPFDREAHKKGLIGPSAELADVIWTLEGACCACWDVGHLVLGGEDPLRSFRNLRPYVSHLHLSNCILDPAHPDFGDRHLPPGEPGFLTMQRARELLRAIAGQLREAGKRCSVAVEVRGREEQDPEEVVAFCQRALLETAGCDDA